MAVGDGCKTVQERKLSLLLIEIHLWTHKYYLTCRQSQHKCTHLHNSVMQHCQSYEFTLDAVWLWVCVHKLIASNKECMTRTWQTYDVLFSFMKMATCQIIIICPSDGFIYLRMCMIFSKSLKVSYLNLKYSLSEAVSCLKYENRPVPTKWETSYKISLPSYYYIHVV